MLVLKVQLKGRDDRFSSDGSINSGVHSNDCIIVIQQRSVKLHSYSYPCNVEKEARFTYQIAKPGSTVQTVSVHTSCQEVFSK